MSHNTNETVRERCRAIFGYPAPPDRVWEGEFDHNDAALQELGRRDWRYIEAGSLDSYYILNLEYVEPLQPELFRYLFPMCLAEWHRLLMSNNEFVNSDNWYRALRRPCLFETMMTPDQGNGVRAFLVEGMLEKLNQERGLEYGISRTPAYVWMRALNELGGSVPLIEQLWSRWWSVDSPGKAVSTLMYLSGLIYAKGENPIFGKWTPERGGGGPYLSEMALEGWLPENLEVLRRYLTPERVLTSVELSAQRLRDEPEATLAARIAVDARTRRDIITIQIDDLIEELASRYQSQIATARGHDGQNKP